MNNVLADSIVKAGIIFNAAPNFNFLHLNVSVTIGGNVVTVIPPQLSGSIKRVHGGNKEIIVLNVGALAAVIGQYDANHMSMEARFNGVLTTIIIPYAAISEIIIYDNADRSKILYMLGLPTAGSSIDIAPLDVVENKSSRPSLTLVK